jgi:hypothetical protein
LIGLLAGPFEVEVIVVLERIPWAFSRVRIILRE